MITVSAVNDAPVNTVPGAQSVVEETATAISGISVNDADNNLVAIGKFNNPVAKDDSIARTIVFDIDF